MEIREQRIEAVEESIYRLAELAHNAPPEAQAALIEANRLLNAALEELQGANAASLREAEKKVEASELRARKVTRLSQAFAEAGLDYQGVLKTVTRDIGKTFGDACVILIQNESGSPIKSTAYYLPETETSTPLEKMLGALKTEQDMGIAAQVLKRHKPLALRGAETEVLKGLVPRGHKSIYDQHPVKSALITPLMSHGRLIGLLLVLRFTSGDPHHEEERQLLVNIAGQAALAIENARLYARETQRARALDGLHAATAALLTTLDLDELLGRILDAAQSAIPAAEKGTLHLVAPDSGKLQTSALLGYSESPIKIAISEVTSEYIVEAVRDRKPLLISDTEMPPPSLETGELIADHPIRSSIIAPLILGDAVLGVLSLNASQPRAFTKADLRLLESFAATTSAAIQNARLHAKVQKMAITDPLTGLYNRRGFYELGRREIERLRRFGHPLSAILLDIDDFKHINDTYGHGTGDQVLKALADRLNNNIRGVDILGRFGGDEFSILLPETDLATTTVIGGRLRRAMAKHPVTTDDGLLSVTISLGIARATEDMVDLDTLLNLADGAMYAAKQAGKDRVEVGETIQDQAK